jgi:hypothetical protein
MEWGHDVIIQFRNGDGTFSLCTGVYPTPGVLFSREFVNPIFYLFFLFCSFTGTGNKTLGENTYQALQVLTIELSVRAESGFLYRRVEMRVYVTRVLKLIN